MKIVEQQIWDYLDGTCDEQESKEIARLIEADPAYKAVYSDLKNLHQDLGKIELDQPSMAFTRNVMDKISAMPVPGVIRSLTDKRIIYGIGAFFLISILVLLTMVFYQVDWTKPAAEVLPDLRVPTVDYSSYINGTYLRIFLFADLILGLYILDSLMRKKMISK